MSKIKVNTVAPRSGTTVTLGESGDTIELGTGASQTGFGRTGTVDWCTTAKTSPLTAVSGKGYFINTTGGAVTVTLPSSPTAGDIVSLKDYLDTWGTACKAVTLGRGGSKIGGNCLDATLSTAGQSLTMIYVDGTQGWENVQTDTSVVGQEFVEATGGTITTSGNYKIHTFTGNGCFQVTDAGGPSGSTTVDYMIVGGGAGGGYNGSGGGGAGGWRATAGTGSGCYTAGPSPLTSPVSPMPVSVATYPVVVGGGGIAGTTPSPGPATAGGPGSVSSFNSIVSAGGGGGGGPSPNDGIPGASGGGAGRAPGTPGAGNVPSTTPPQGNAGGTNGNPGGAGAGGGATAVGQNGLPGAGPGVIGGAGGAGSTSCISGSPVAYAGGGGGASDPYAGLGGAGGTGGGGGGGGCGPCATPGVSGTTNRGGGGGGGGNAKNGGAGGSGIVIIRYQYQ